MTSGHRHRILMLIGAVLALGLQAAIASAQSSISFSGRAYGASLHLTTPPSDQVFADTGPLPPEGGMLTAEMASIGTAALTASAVACTTSGSGSSASSSAQAASVSAFAGGPAALTATEVRAESHANCAEAPGETIITGLTLAGLEVKVTGQPNQTVVIPGVATLVINEQIRQSGPPNIEVRALRLTLATGEELIVASAHSDVSCATPAQRSTWGEVKSLYR